MRHDIRHDRSEQVLQARTGMYIGNIPGQDCRHVINQGVGNTKISLS